MKAPTTKVYMAGKVAKNGFRDKLCKNSRVMSRLGERYSTGEYDFRYWGPMAISCDHGCFHDGFHGQGYPGLECTGSASFGDMGGVFDEFDFPDGRAFETDGGDAHCPTFNDAELEMSGSPDYEFLVSRCFKLIDTCDLFYAWIDSLDCYGTLVELGYAAAKPDVHVVVQVDNALRDRAFVQHGRMKGDSNLEDDSAAWMLMKNELWFPMSTPGVDARFLPAPSMDLALESYFGSELCLGKVHRHIKANCL